MLSTGRTPATSATLTVGVEASRRTVRYQSVAGNSIAQGSQFTVVYNKVQYPPTAPTASEVVWLLLLFRTQLPDYAMRSSRSVMTIDLCWLLLRREKRKREWQLLWLVIASAIYAMDVGYPPLHHPK